RARSADAPGPRRSYGHAGRTRPRHTRRTGSRSDSRPPRAPGRAAAAAARRRGSRRVRAGSRMARALEPLTVLALELERRVLDVEVAAQAALELVEDRVRVGSGVDDDVRGEKVHPARDRPHVQVMDVAEAGAREHVTAEHFESHTARS